MHGLALLAAVLLVMTERIQADPYDDALKYRQTHYFDDLNAKEQAGRALIYEPQTGPSNFNSPNDPTGAPTGTPPNSGGDGEGGNPGPIQVDQGALQAEDTKVVTVFLLHTDSPMPGTIPLGGQQPPQPPPPPGPPMTNAQVQAELDNISAAYKGTGNIAGVAVALYLFNQHYIQTNAEPWYHWGLQTVSATTPGYNTGIVETFDPGTYLMARQMACYEFVDFCAWIASDRPTRTPTRPLAPGEKPPPGDPPPPTGLDNNGNTVYFVPAGPPEVKWGAQISVFGNPIPGDPRTDAPPTGNVVVGQAWAWNNKSGYFHVGISVGGGRVVGLGSDGLIDEPAGDVFPSIWYPTVFSAPYNYDTTNPAPAVVANAPAPAPAPAPATTPMPVPSPAPGPAPTPATK